MQRFGTGQLIAELASALEITSAEVVETGEPGKVTISFVIKVQAQGDPNVIVTPNLARTTPKRELRTAFFLTIDGGLHRDDPRQIPLDFRRVDTSTGEVHAIDDE